MKPKVGVFGLTGCGGCQLQILNLERELLEIAGKLDFVNFLMAASNPSDTYEVAIIEGGVSTNAQKRLVKEIGKRAGIAILIGACAVLGGIPKLKNLLNADKVKKLVYGKSTDFLDTTSVQPVDELIEAHWYIYGCPPPKSEILEVIKALLLGIEPRIPSYPVCVECRIKENVCVFDKGMFCFGPVTRAGCDAWCPSAGSFCAACRGLVDDPNLNSERDILKEHGVAVEEMIKRARLFGVEVKVAKSGY